MSAQSPKHIVKNFRNRNVSYGNRRRLNSEKKLVEHQPHFPKTLSYEDFDRTLFEWVDKEFDLVYNGSKLKTYKLFSNQRMTEYGQTWENRDDKGNLDINFKTITREPNPQKGDIYGGAYAIPGNITFPIFRLKTVDENGMEYTEVYSMKQPFAVNLIYTIGIFTNTYSMLNKMNAEVHRQFKSIEKYIFPNGFAIPMELNSVSDESEYTIDDRKYYGQTFQLKVMGYLVSEEDYVVTKVPSRAKMQFVSGRNSSLKSKEKFDIQQLALNTPVVSETGCNTIAIENDTVEKTQEELMIMPANRTSLEIEELCGRQPCFENSEDEFYVNRKVILNLDIDYCQQTVEFVSEWHLGIESIEIRNITGIKLFIDGEEMDITDSDVDILIGDNVTISTQVYDPKEPAQVIMVCYDLDSVLKPEEEQETEEINL